MILVLLAKDMKDLRAYKLGEATMERAVHILQKLQVMAGETVQPGRKPNDIAVYLVPHEYVEALTVGDTSVLAEGASTFIGKTSLWMSAKEFMEFMDLAKIRFDGLAAVPASEG